ncbi:MAG: pilus (MSHA type) biogenesis protein MshL, partial [Proteobacteria bacterium]|nr:pilus (MSHA type) biogenesis protein MshL [Pseudomonadota bacterium]
AADFSGNNSTTTVTSRSFHRFWENLSRNIHAIIGIDGGSTGETIISTENVIISPESGVVTVKATAEQHEEIQYYIDLVTASLQRQILIEATVVEVTLNDQFQTGIDWESVRVAAAGGLSIATSLIGTPGLAAAPPFTATTSSLILNYDNPEGAGRNISATLSLLREFGDTKVLSSPQLMVLNNHTAVLKVVENFVYFDIEQEVATSTVAGVAPTVATTATAQTVPIGLVMAVTPQVDKNDVVTLNVRPTISSVVSTTNDPTPGLTIANAVPVVRVREMESILRVSNQQIAVLGGLMQDTIIADNNEVPFLSDIPIVGEGFKSRDRRSQKSELVIFIRPVVVKNASLDGDLANYKQYLERQNLSLDDVKPSMKHYRKE